MVRPRATYARQHINRIVVLHDGSNPSVDFYLRSRLQAADLPPVDYIDIAVSSPRWSSMDVDGAGGVFVIVCRYIDGCWLDVLEKNGQNLAGLAYFVDDDLPAMLADHSLPVRYRMKIWLRYARRADRLSALASQLWVATPALEEKYRDHGATLLPPLYIENPAMERRIIRYFYHGTAAHEAEKNFIADVVREVQLRNPDTLFEIIGGRKTRKLFHGIDRVVVLHPMDWPAYFSYSNSARLDIGLAPLFKSHVNAGRSHTKYFEFTRIGAAGIYSDRAPYANIIDDSENGVLLPDDGDRWVEAILDLAANNGKVQAMVLAARARCPMEDDSFKSLPDLPGQDSRPRAVD